MASQRHREPASDTSRGSDAGLDASQTSSERSTFERDVPELSPDARALFASYGFTDDDQLKQHLRAVRDKAWSIYPYNCIGRWMFLRLRMSQHPLYSEVRSKIRDGASLLDIGCCLGQDLRKLVADGAPAAQVYGTDLRQSFIDLGYDLFQDRTTAPRMIAADFLADPAASSPSLTALEGRFEIIHACSFFHVFSRDEQLRACTRALRLLHEKPGSFVFGTQPGGGAHGKPRDDPREDAAKRCWHSKETWRELWLEVGRRVGTRLEVDVEDIKEIPGSISFIVRRPRDE